MFRITAESIKYVLLFDIWGPILVAIVNRKFFGLPDNARRMEKSDDNDTFDVDVSTTQSVLHVKQQWLRHCVCM